jgi:NADPH:quinone reductase-like Zn-dependent oxidoreductase
MESGMSAWTYDRWGGADELKFIEAGTPALESDAVRIEVEWAGVNPADWKVLSGKYRTLARGGFPRRIGIEGSGHVVAVGPNVKGLEPGMPVVFGLDPLDGRRGSWAEQVDVPVARLLAVPDGVSLRTAAILPIAGLTAWQMCAYAGLTEGSDVLVTGASGGVGHLAVQIAKTQGAHVTATGSEKNRSMIEALGVDRFLDYRASPAERSGLRWDAILDCVNSLRSVSGALLKPAGHYVDTDPRPLYLFTDRLRNAFSARKHYTVMVDFETRGMQALFDLLSSERIRPTVSHEYPLERAPDALRESLSGHAVGKLVLKVR